MGNIEVMMLFDQEAYNDITKKNNFTIVQYAAIMTKAMNVIYSSMSNPKLQLVLAGARNLVLISHIVSAGLHHTQTTQMRRAPRVEGHQKR